MTISYNQLSVRVDLSALRANYRLLDERGGCAWPVVKADAYGHGLVEAVAALKDEGARTFCVGTADEAARLRNCYQGPIVSLLGPLNHADSELLAAIRAMPFVAGFEALESLGAACAGMHLPVVLKFDTGMSRLGFGEADIPRLAAFLEQTPQLVPRFAATHLATADEPHNFEIMQEQGERFSRILAALAGRGLHLGGCVANSAAILRGELLFDVQRPGISLYGTNPFAGTAHAELGQDLSPVMAVSAPIVQVRELVPGQCVSYGCTFTADRPMRVAVVAAGYADGYSRGLSGQAQMCVRGLRARVLGRICMQLTVVDVTGIDGVSFGERAWLLGGEGEAAVTAGELAGWWETITYEVFCLLGQNPRIYL